MSAPIVATEEIRNSLAALKIASAAQIAEDLTVSASTVRRHLALLVERGDVTRASDRGIYYRLTDAGRAASEANGGF